MVFSLAMSTPLLLLGHWDLSQSSQECSRVWVVLLLLSLPKCATGFKFLRILAAVTLFLEWNWGAHGFFSVFLLPTLGEIASSYPPALQRLTASPLLLNYSLLLNARLMVGDANVFCCPGPAAFLGKPCILGPQG